MFEQNQGLLRPALQPLDAAAAQGRLRQGCVGVPVGSLARPCQEVTEIVAEEDREELG